MTKSKLEISENGYVYEHRGRTRARGKQSFSGAGHLLGHISSLLHQRTPLGARVRRFWRIYMQDVDESVRNNDSLSETRAHA